MTNPVQKFEHHVLLNSPDLPPTPEQQNAELEQLKAGLTQKQVAEKLGLKCEDRLSHWERGQAMPSVKNLIKISKLYNTSLETIYSFK